MKSTILFVDDEQNILSGIKRIFFKYRNDYEVFLANSGNDAIKILNEKEMDIIVTDIRMPQMNGLELLEFIAQNFPNTIRLVLSGFSDSEITLKSSNFAHRFLSKPLKAEELKKNISDILKYKKEFNCRNILTKLNGTLELPSIPDTYIRLELKLNSQDASFLEIGKIVSEDITMTAKILQIVNSAFWGIPQKIKNIDQALKFLGINQIKSLVMYVKIFTMLKVDEAIMVNVNLIWQHSHCVAMISSDIARLFKFSKSDVEDIYFAALLHDIGKIILLKLDEFTDNVGYFNKEYHDVSESEKKRFGVDHSEVGKYILGIWNLPVKIVECVGNHHTEKLPEINFAGVVSIANKISNELSNKIELYKSLNVTQKNELINKYLNHAEDYDG